MAISLLRPRAISGSELTQGDLILQFDGDIRRVSEQDAVVVDHEAEEGADIQDLVKPNQPRYRLTGIVTDTPTEEQDSNPEPVRSLSARATVQLMLENAELISLVSAGVSDDNLVIESYTHEEGKDTGHAAQFDISLRKIKFVKPLTVTFELPVARVIEKQGYKPLTHEDYFERDASERQFIHWQVNGWLPGVAYGPNG